MLGIKTTQGQTTFCPPVPFQIGITEALNKEDGKYENVPKIIEENCIMLTKALRQKGFTVYECTFFFLIRWLISSGCFFVSQRQRKKIE